MMPTATWAGRQLSEPSDYRRQDELENVIAGYGVPKASAAARSTGNAAARRGCCVYAAGWAGETIIP